MLRVVVPDIAGYDAFYKRLIAAVPLVKNVTSRLSPWEKIKSTTGPADPLNGDKRRFAQGQTGGGVEGHRPVQTRGRRRVLSLIVSVPVIVQPMVGPIVIRMPRPRSATSPALAVPIEPGIDIGGDRAAGVPFAFRASGAAPGDRRYDLPVEVDAYASTPSS